MKKFLAVTLLLIAPSAFAVTRAQQLMGTICEITVPDANAPAIDAAFAEGKRIDALLSTWRNDTELARLNKGEIDTPTTELRTLLGIALGWARNTNEAFNPLVAPLIDAWGIRAKGAIPTKEALAAATAKANLENVEIGSKTLVLKNGAAFDPGAFGKGYAIDRMIGVLREQGASRAQINFGGQIGVYGDQPFVTIADPDHRDQPAVALLLRTTSISTTSGSEQSFNVNGRTFTHIVDPRSGEALPPRGSVSVIDRSALKADILSTALYVMGPDQGMKWAKEHNVTAIFITDAGKVLTSGPITELQVYIKER